MRARNHIVIILSLLLAAGCVKQPEPQGTDMHEFTEAELQKKKLDDAFTIFFQDLDVESISKEELLNNSQITIPRMGIVRYTYSKGGLIKMRIDIGKEGFKADLHGGIHLEGVGIGENGTKVFIDGEQVATMDFVKYEYKDSGEMKSQLVPVFRFDDGTTYAVSGALLVEPLIEYLLKNALSTE